MRPFRIAGMVLGAVALGMLAFLALGLLLPGTWEAERSRTLPAAPDEVYAHLAAAEAWGGWTPTPDSGVELFGPAEGPGSGRRWDDPGYGRGEFVVTEAVPPSEVRYRVEVEGGSIRIEGHIVLEQDGEGTRMRWREAGDFGWNPLLGYLASRMAELQGAQLDSSLRALHRLLDGDRGRSEVRDPPG